MLADSISFSGAVDPFKRITLHEKKEKIKRRHLHRVPKTTHTIATARMKRNVLFCFVQNMQTVISLRGIARARIFTNIVWFFSTAEKMIESRTIQFLHSLSPLPFPQNQETNQKTKVAK